MPADWRDNADCRESVPPDFFFPELGEAEGRLIRAFCAECPVRIECRDYALDNFIDDGWWGGLSPKTLKAIRAERRLAS